MTPSKAIEIIDRLKPNSYDEEDKLRWINELDGMVKRLVYMWDDTYMKGIEAQYKSGKLTEEEYNEIIDKTKPYSYPEDLNKELLIPAPFDEVYSLYLEAKIDYHNREYINYNNSATMFELRFSEFKKDYIRNHPVRG